MRYIIVRDCNDVPHEVPIYEIHELPLDEIVSSTEVVKNRFDQYLNIPCAFDIETTTINSDRPYAFMYHWQFCIGDMVVFGTTWEEFQYLISRLHASVEFCPQLKYIIYCHNLAYEFQFMYRFLHITSIFARDKGKPLKVRTSDGVEFRCSYILSNMSLSNFCKNSKGCTFWKRDGDNYNYSKLRTPNTPTTPEEEEYDYCDVRGLCQCIYSLMREDNLKTIPMTSTGYVRREFRAYMAKNEKNRFHMKKLALNPETYQLCKEAFRGGDTSSNTLFVGEILENVKSYDLQSSYPCAMLMDKFPMTKFIKVNVDSPEKLNSYINEYACLFRVIIEDIEVKSLDTIPYISHSKALNKNVKGRFCNGRILYAERLVMTLTDIDWKIILEEYDIRGNVVFEKFYIAAYGYLPIDFRVKLLDYFRQKCELKLQLKKLSPDTEEYEDIDYIYNKFKNRINSSYGMMVTDITSPEVVFDGNEWSEEEMSIEDALKNYYASYNSFLSYQHGIWVTANARKRLRDAMHIIGRDVVYIDTDSIKYVNDHTEDFNKLNELHRKKMLECNLDIIVDIDSTKFYIGEWEFEGSYDRFITCGSKKYLIEKNGECHLTLAGVNKKKGSEWLNKVHTREYIDEDTGETYTETNKGCEAFKMGLIIPSEICGRTSAHYNYDDIHEITINRETFTTASNIAIVNADYTLGIGESLLILAHMLRRGL